MTRSSFFCKALSIAVLIIGGLGSEVALADMPSKESQPDAPKHPIPEATLALTSANSIIDALGARGALPGNKVLLEIPDIFYSSKYIPVRIRSELNGTEVVVFVVDRLPRPLVLALAAQKTPEPDIFFTIDLIKTSKVRALVKADGKWYSVEKTVRLATETWKAK